MPGILLVCEGDHESVSINQHTYAVRDGYCLVDTTPFNDSRADPTDDATQICSIFHSESNFGQVQRSRIFRPARKDETDRWLKDETNRALYMNTTVDKLRDVEVETTARAAVQADLAAKAAQQAADNQRQAAADAQARRDAEKATQAADTK